VVKIVSLWEFILEIRIIFKYEKDLDKFVKLWAPTADYCFKNEPNLLAYHISKSDKDPKQLLVFERFRSRGDYVGAHRSSGSFFAFKAALAKAGLQYTMDGHSYNETEYGFMDRMS
jgi:quinol monooxygenase YgiN